MTQRQMDEVVALVYAYFSGYGHHYNILNFGEIDLKNEEDLFMLTIAAKIHQLYGYGVKVENNFIDRVKIYHWMFKKWNYLLQTEADCEDIITAENVKQFVTEGLKAEGKSFGFNLAEIYEEYYEV